MNYFPNRLINSSRPSLREEAKDWKPVTKFTRAGSNGKLKQYALELSNVDLTNEFATMISHQRSFQAGSRVVTTSDAILSEAVNLKR